MSAKTNKTVSIIETYLRESANLPPEEKPAPEEIEFHIAKLLIDAKLVDQTFSIEVVPLENSYILRSRNHYTSIILGAMPMFCKVCGKLLEPLKFRGKERTMPGYLSCSHEQSEPII